MKKIIFLSFALLMPALSFSQVESDYVGMNFIYSTANLTYENIRKSGYGGEIFYYTLISKEICSTINLGFFYLPYIVNKSDTFKNASGIYELHYTTEENFYNFTLGFTLNYIFRLTEKFIRSSNKFLKKLYPYVGTGIYSTFIYKSISYKYETPPPEFIDVEKNSRWLPAVATVPFILGFNHKTSNKLLINTGIKYSILLYDQFTEKYGYNDVFSIYIGILYKVKYLF